MAYNFRTCDRDQAFLLPPDVRDWLPGDHLAWFVLDVVDQLDLGPAPFRFLRLVPGLAASSGRERHVPCATLTFSPFSAAWTPWK